MNVDQSKWPEEQQLLQRWEEKYGGEDYLYNELTRYYYTKDEQRVQGDLCGLAAIRQEVAFIVRQKIRMMREEERENK